MKLIVFYNLNLLVFLVFLSTNLTAQKVEIKTINLKISVVDAGGNFINSAKITLLSELGAEMQTVQTNEWGDAKFKDIAAGKYRLRVQSEGFAVSTTDVIFGVKNNNLQIQLEIQGINERVEVPLSKSEKNADPRNNTTNILTAEQIAQLPDDPEELEQTLKNMAGPGALISVNGFRGGKLPPKSQIREIRFRTNPFSADSHDADNFGIDVFTKPGLDDWHGGFGFAFRDESLNARNPLSFLRPPEQTRRLNFDLSGTLVPKRTSLSLSANYNNSFESAIILAALPDGKLQDTFRQPRRTLDLTARIEHAVSPVKNLLFEFQRNGNNKFNLGVGNFDLKERAYDSFQTENIARLSYTGHFFKKYYNEFRSQAIWTDEKDISKSFARTIEVLNAFVSGGAQINRRRRFFQGEIADNVDMAFGKHALRTGFLFEFGHFNFFDESNRNGTFTFSSLADFQNRRPLLYTQRTGTPETAFNRFQFGWYLQDDWRIRKNLTLSYGLRHEWQSNVNDLSNFAPRLSIVWSPFENGKTTFRFGSGIYYDWLSSEIYAQTLLVNGSRQQDLSIINPNYPDPFSGGGSSEILPPGKIQLSQKLKQPTLWKNLFFFEQKIFPKVNLNIFYERSRGWQEFRGRNINAPQGIGLSRPDPRFGNVTQIESGARSDSQSLNIGLGWVNFPKFAVNFNYQLGQIINESDSPLILPVNNNDARAERGFASNDVRHQLSIFGVLKLWKNFRFSGFSFIQSGTPYNITTGFDNNGDGIINDRPAGVRRNSGRGDWTFSANCRLSWSFGFGKANSSSNNSQRAKVVKFEDGADTMPGSGPFSADVKTKYRVELYLQALNLLNRANFSTYSGVQTSPFFGQPISAFPARKIETGLRFNF